MQHHGRDRMVIQHIRFHARQRATLHQPGHIQIDDEGHQPWFSTRIPASSRARHCGNVRPDQDWRRCRRKPSHRSRCPAADRSRPVRKAFAVGAHIRMCTAVAESASHLRIIGVTQHRLQIVCTPAAQYEALAAQLYRLIHTGTRGGGRVMPHHRERAILRLRACALADRFASADSRGCSGVKCVVAPVTCVDQPLRRQHARSHRPRRRTHDSCAWPISPASTSLLVSRRTMCRRHSGISRLPVFVILALANAFLPTARCNMPMVSGNNTHAAARTISPQTVFGYGPMALAWTVSRSAAARPALPSNSVAPAAVDHAYISSAAHFSGCRPDALWRIGKCRRIPPTWRAR